MCTARARASKENFISLWYLWICAHAAVGSIVLYQELWCVWIANTYYGRIKMLFQNELRLFFFNIIRECFADDMYFMQHGTLQMSSMRTYYCMHARTRHEKIMP